MPAWWDSLETMTAVSSYARTVAWVLGIAVFLCGTVVFFAGRQVDALKARRDADRHLTQGQRSRLIELLGDGA